MNLLQFFALRLREKLPACSAICFQETSENFVSSRLHALLFGLFIYTLPIGQAGASSDTNKR